jgi:hypothetical protein
LGSDQASDHGLVCPGASDQQDTTRDRDSFRG